MASALRNRFSQKSIPEEASSFYNIQESFPNLFEDGKRLLQQTAGKIQVMRLETEIFPLTIEVNRELIRHRQAEYKQIGKDVEKYRESLKTVNGQIKRAIDLCSQVPVSDVRVWEKEDLAVRVYDLCQEYLPILRDWQTHGTLLDKRFHLVMTQDQKHYEDSMLHFSSTVNPSSSSLLSTVAGFFTGWAASSASSSELETEERKRLELEAKLAQIKLTEPKVEEQKKK